MRQHVVSLFISLLVILLWSVASGTIGRWLLMRRRWQGQTGHWAKEEFDYETVHNIDEVQAEFSVSMREGIRHWNRTVQYWLAVYFYKRLPLPRPLRSPVFLLSLSFSQSEKSLHWESWLMDDACALLDLAN